MTQEHPDWVKMCQYLDMEPPHPLYSHKDESINKLVEIRDYFKQKNQEDYMVPFVEYLATLNVIPKNGGAKLDQVLKSVRLRKLSSKILNAIEDL